MNKYIKNQKGAISIFTVLAMIFFLVFVLGAFTLVSRRNQTQVSSLTDLRALYKKNGNEIYMSLLNPADSVIPIYGENDFIAIGTNVIKTINKKNYTFSMSSNYILKNDIKINLEKIYNSDLPIKDFTIYSDSYNVSKSSFDVFYMYDEDLDGEKEKYKLVAYSKEGKQSVSNSDRDEKKFSILNEAELEKYKFNNKYVFLTLDILDYYHGFTKNETDVIPNDIEELESYKNLDSRITAYYVFLKAEAGDVDVNVPVDNTVTNNTTNNIVNPPVGDRIYLADVAQVGDYVNYPIEYDNVPTNVENDGYERYVTPYFTSDLKGWRVISINKDTKEVKLISAGTPLSVTYDFESYDRDDYNSYWYYSGRTINISLTNVNDLITKLKNDFESSIWDNIITNRFENINQRQIRGREFIDDRYATAVGTIDKNLFENSYGDSIDIDDEIDTGWTTSRNYRLLNNGSKYVIADYEIVKTTEQYRSGWNNFYVYFNSYTILGLDCENKWNGVKSTLTTIPNESFENDGVTTKYSTGLRPVVTLKPKIYTIGREGEHGGSFEDAWQLIDN